MIVNPTPTSQPLRHQLRDEEQRLALRILSMPLIEYQDVAVTLRLNNFDELQQLLCFENNTLWLLDFCDVSVNTNHVFHGTVNGTLFFTNSLY